jgi:phage regulator Rha-like protein
MSDLITIKDGEAVTTSLAIAAGTKNDHASVIKLVRKHRADLESFGLVRFEIQPRQVGQHGGADIEFAVLNEQQSALVIAFMRNSEIVRSFKVALVKGFFEMRAKLNAPDPLADLPPEQQALVALMVDNVKIKAKQAELEAEQAIQQESIKRIEAKQSAFEEGHSFFTVMGFCALRGIKLAMRDMQRLGRAAGTLSREKSIPIDKVRDARYGVVNAYHETTLEAALVKIHGGM